MGDQGLAVLTPLSHPAFAPRVGEVGEEVINASPGSGQVVSTLKLRSFTGRSPVRETRLDAKAKIEYFCRSGSISVVSGGCGIRTHEEAHAP